MDYGKFKYEAAQKARESRRNQTNTVIKEMKLRPKIDQHDYDTKKGHVVRFLRSGDKVKITIMFRGREQHRPELGFRLLQRLAADVEDLGFVESTPRQDGRNMTMVIGPLKKKSEARAEVKAEKVKAATVKAAEREADREIDKAHREASEPDGEEAPPAIREHRSSTWRHDMPKMKSNSGIKKRVKITGTGKLMHEKGRRRTHLMQKQSSGRSRLDGGHGPDREGRPQARQEAARQVSDAAVRRGPR
ncbi:MAG: translation initiation factor IF-3 [Nocardioidaceae bacterium]